MKQKANSGLTLPSSFLQVIIADDYSDPFDAKNDLKSKAGKGESAGYMEPYEAQRIMTGKQKRPGALRSQGGEGEADPSQPQQGKVCAFKVLVGRRHHVESSPQFYQFVFYLHLREEPGRDSAGPDTRVPGTVKQDRDGEFNGEERGEHSLRNF